MVLETDDERRRRAFELRAAGWTVAAIKRELRVGSTKVDEWLEGVPPPRARVRRSKWSDQRAAARERRLRGESYRQIQAALGIPKSTLSGWLRDVPLTDEQRAHLVARQEDGVRSRAVAIRAARVRRTEELQSAAAAEVGPLRDRELFLLGVVAYWAEGSKAKPWSVSTKVKFINSDRHMIELFLAGLRLVGVTDDRLDFRLSIHESADVDAATAYWAAVVGLDRGAFRRPSLKRHNPKTVRHNTAGAYVGCLVVSVRRSTDLNRQIAGWWTGIAAGVQQGVDTIELPSGMV